MKELLKRKFPIILALLLIFAVVAFIIFNAIKSKPHSVVKEKPVKEKIATNKGKKEKANSLQEIKEDLAELESNTTVKKKAGNTEKQENGKNSKQENNKNNKTGNADAGGVAKEVQKEEVSSKEVQKEEVNYKEAQEVQKKEVSYTDKNYNYNYDKNYNYNYNGYNYGYRETYREKAYSSWKKNGFSSSKRKIEMDWNKLILKVGNQILTPQKVK